MRLNAEFRIELLGRITADVMAWLPALAGVLLLGGLIARVVGEAVGTPAAGSGAPASPALGQAVRYVLIVFALILALEQLGVDTPLLSSAAVAVAGAGALGLAVAFGLGSRELARNIMAGLHARDEFTPGQQLSAHGHTGRLARIGPLKSVIETGSGRISLPNSILIEGEVTIVGGPGTA